jgi:hypothetical protein
MENLEKEKFDVENIIESFQKYLDVLKVNVPRIYDSLGKLDDVVKIEHEVQYTEGFVGSIEQRLPDITLYVEVKINPPENRNDEDFDEDEWMEKTDIFKAVVPFIENEKFECVDLIKFYLYSYKTVTLVFECRNLF